jgi:hypothetical protein
MGQCTVTKTSISVNYMWESLVIQSQMPSAQIHKTKTSTKIAKTGHKNISTASRNLPNEP